MTTSKPILLATSGTVDGILKCINAFFYSESCAVFVDLLHGRDRQSPVTNSHSQIVPGVRVVKRGARYRFEGVAAVNQAEAAAARQEAMLAYLNPRLDDHNRRLLNERAAAWERMSAPRVGDFLQLEDGTLLRFARDLGDSIQTTTSTLAAADSFRLDVGAVSFSGAMEGGACEKKRLHDSGNTITGRFWFFSHDEARADNTIDVLLACRVFWLEGLG